MMLSIRMHAEMPSAVPVNPGKSVELGLRTTIRNTMHPSRIVASQCTATAIQVSLSYLYPERGRSVQVNVGFLYFRGARSLRRFKISQKKPNAVNAPNSRMTNSLVIICSTTPHRNLVCPTLCASAAPRVYRDRPQVEPRYITNFRRYTGRDSGVGLHALVRP
jgi:hypothetical protein